MVVVVRGRYEIAELVTGCVGSVGLYIGGLSLLPLKYDPDLAAALFLLSSVIVIHHLRVMSYPPAKKVWHLFLELLALYFLGQVLLAFIWEQFHDLLDLIRDAVLNTGFGLFLLKQSPSLVMFLRHDLCYFVQVGISVMLTIKTLALTKALDYVLPNKHVYQVCDDLDKDEIMSFNVGRSASRRRTR